jgi:hypothetical protein
MSAKSLQPEDAKEFFAAHRLSMIAIGVIKSRRSGRHFRAIHRRFRGSLHSVEEFDEGLQRGLREILPCPCAIFCFLELAGHQKALLMFEAPGQPNDAERKASGLKKSNWI